MNLDNLMPRQQFSTAELHEIAETLHKPALRKYLKHQQVEFVKAIGNGLPSEDQTDTAYLRKQAVVVGGLQVLEVLLSVAKPAEAGSVQS